jgi:hypothetical protein
MIIAYYTIRNQFHQLTDHRLICRQGDKELYLIKQNKECEQIWEEQERYWESP